VPITDNQHYSPLNKINQLPNTHSEFLTAKGLSLFNFTTSIWT